MKINDRITPLADSFRHGSTGRSEIESSLKAASERAGTLQRQFMAAKESKGGPDPVLIGKIAGAQAEVAMLQAALDQYDARSREAATPLARAATELYRDLRALQLRNRERARATTRSAISKYFAPDRIDLAVPHARLVASAESAWQNGPLCSVGYDSTTDTCHPDVPPEKIVSEAIAVQRAFELAVELEREIG